MNYAGYVSFHVGNSGGTGMGQISISHNRRLKEFMEKEKQNYEAYLKQAVHNRPFHIDFAKTKDNETLIPYQDVKEVYKNVFQLAVDAQDKKLKSRDRKGDYYHYINARDIGKGCTHLLYEVILQFGDEVSTSDDTTRKACTNALKDYVQDFAKRNPDLYITGAYLHLDEASPHVHLDFIPIHRKTKGQAVENNLAGVLKEQEKNMLQEMISRGEHKDVIDHFKAEITKTGKMSNPQTRWQDRERQKMREIALKHDLIVEAMKKPEKSVHYDTRAHKAKMSAEEAERTAEIAQKRLESIEESIEKAEIVKSQIIATATASANELKKKAEEEAAKVSQKAEQEAQETLRRSTAALQASQSRLSALDKEIHDKEVERATIASEGLNLEAKNRAIAEENRKLAEENSRLKQTYMKRCEAVRLRDLDEARKDECEKVLDFVRDKYEIKVYPKQYEEYKQTQALKAEAERVHHHGMHIGR